MGGERARGGKKGRKIGRASRKPAHKRYVASGKRDENRKRRQKRHEKREAYFAKRRAAKKEIDDGTKTTG